MVEQQERKETGSPGTRWAQTTCIYHGTAAALCYLYAPTFTLLDTNSRPLKHPPNRMPGNQEVMGARLWRTAPLSSHSWAHVACKATTLPEPIEFSCRDWLVCLRQKVQSNFILFSLGLLPCTKDGTYPRPRACQVSVLPLSHTSTPQVHVHKKLAHSVGVGKDTESPGSGDFHSEQASCRAELGKEA